MSVEFMPPVVVDTLREEYKGALLVAQIDCSDYWEAIHITRQRIGNAMQIMWKNPALFKPYEGRIYPSLTLEEKNDIIAKLGFKLGEKIQEILGDARYG